MDSQSLSVPINEGLEQGFVVGDGLQDVPVGRHVPDRPLTEPSAAEPENVAEEQQRRTLVLVPVRRTGDGAASPAGLVDEPLQAGFDLVVGQEGHVAGMSHRQTVPVPQQGRPRLETETADKHSVFLQRGQHC